MNNIGYIKEKYSGISFNLNENTYTELPVIIKQCIISKKPLRIYTSMGDDKPDLELCQIPNVKLLFIKACQEYGLLGFLNYQCKYTNGDEFIQTVIAVACGVFVSNEDDSFIYKIELNEVQSLIELSTKKFNELWSDLIDK